MDEVRRSIVRISFKWNKVVKTSSKGRVLEFETKDIVVAGVIVERDKEGSLIVIVDGTFYTHPLASQCTKKKVYLPNPEGGYEEHNVEHDELIDTVANKNYLCALKLKQVKEEIKDYVTPLMFETMVGQAENLHSFIFPTEDYITPTAYCPGSTIDAYKQLVIHACHVHEYAQFGSPLLNERGHLVGICSGSQGQTQAWSVEFLKDYFRNSKLSSVTSKIFYSRNGIRIHEG